MSLIKGVLANLSSVVRSKSKSSDKLSSFLILNQLLIKEKLGRKTRNVIKHKIYDYPVYSSTYSNLRYLFREIFVLNEYTFHSPNPAPVIIDCGANVGMAVLYFKKMYPNAHIKAFEANPNTYTILSKNVTENGLKDVEVYNVALHNEETEISFFADADAGSLVGSFYQTRGGGQQIQVKTKKLSDYIKGLGSIDLMKIDVEGAETGIVEDLIDSSLLDKTKEYIVEYHHNFGNEPSRLSNFIQMFESKQFSCNVKADYSELNAFQDISLHFYKK